ncbi:phosphatidylserine decarboxylase-domain-containing protein [Pisolithus marmoratus]|nr:phosphatidylserine decarboxylase-domain-containing protein [Pisolithus marmoratus]
MPRVPKKAQKLGRALKTAAKFPVRVSGGRGSGRAHLSPSPGECPVVVLRVQVLACKDLAMRSRGVMCDPFVVVSLLNTRHHTPVLKRTSNPDFSSKDTTFDFPLYLSLADRLGALEIVVWDKDGMIKKEYLGEVPLALEDWFTEEQGGLGFYDEGNKPLSLKLVSTRAATYPFGSVMIKLGFITPPLSPANGGGTQMSFEQVYAEFCKRSRPSLVSAPPTEGIGTLRSHLTGPAFEDDGGISSDDEDDGSSDDSDDSDEPSIPRLTRLFIPSFPSRDRTEQSGRSPNTVRPSPNLDTATATPTPITPTGKTKLPRLFPKRPPLSTRPSYEAAPPVITPSTSSGGSSSSSSASGSAGANGATGIPDTIAAAVAAAGNVPAITVAPAPMLSAASSPPTVVLPPGRGHRRSMSAGAIPTLTGSKMKFSRKSGAPQNNYEYNFSAANDIVGIVMLEVQGATDLPKLKNMTRTGWDMDPFVVISFGKKVFRTRVIRHCLNPVWDEKLLFHVRRYETSFKVMLTVLDWDKLSSNDYVGDAKFDISDLVKDAPQPRAGLGLYDLDEDGSHAMKEFNIPLGTSKEVGWEARHTPMLRFRAKFQPYALLRQRFWAQYLKQYDADDTGTLSHIELTSMLDSLGSTLSAQTIDSFFTRHDKRPAEDELTFPEAIHSLEAELCRPKSERKRLNTEDSFPDSSPDTPWGGVGATGDEPGTLGSSSRPFLLDELDFSGPSLGTAFMHGNESTMATYVETYSTEPSERPLVQVAEPLSTTTSSFATPLGWGGGRQDSYPSSEPEDMGSAASTVGEDRFERVINVKNCPLCHRPRMNSKAEVDIVTHLAICASKDWARVDRIVVGNFVTASQAQRKWYTKIITKVSSGNYKLGANSANIIVQNRMTGQLEEEKMQVYVRLGIRLLYKGARGRMEGARARRLLKSLTFKQGMKYDSPESVRDIQPFIDFHKLDVREILDPIESFKTFNQFFYRQLKPTARPLECPDDPCRLVSSADCRLMVFESVSDATRLWIKGREFTIARLLGDGHRDQAERYYNGSLAIFRLAPQDYHRFHVPVDGTIGKMTDISGEYYTVNPQAIRSALDVYGENARKIIPIDSPQFGRVMAVCVGAMMVGSIRTVVHEGQKVSRGDELGYFAFGGSTIVMLFEKGTVEWDEDLLINGRASLETLVRVGMGIGRCRNRSANGSYIRSLLGRSHEEHGDSDAWYLGT